MASLTELLALAQRQRGPQERPNTPARVAEGFLMGVGSGIDNRREQQKGQLDAYIKMIDLQDKLGKLQAQRENQIQVRNMAKAMGLIPPDPEESMMARGLASGAMSKPAFETPSEVTNSGKMGKFLDDYAPSMSMGSDGVKLNFRKRYKSDKVTSLSQSANIAKAREAMAKNIYNRDHPERQTRDLMDRPIPYNPTSMELQQSGALKAADDLLKNYMGGFDSYVGDTGNEDFILKDTNIDLDEVRQ